MAFADTYSPRPITDIFTPQDGSIDRRQCRRTVPMKVIALGMGRTGTVSLRAALKRLGYEDCYHMLSASTENPPDCLLWQDAFAAKYDGVGKFGREQWDMLLGGCQAVADWPACAFAKELIEAYPEAKIILQSRDVDSWHASTMKTVWWRASEPDLQIISNFSWGAGLYYPMLKKMFDTFFRGDFPNKGKQVFLEHYEEVRSLVPPERLLEYQITDGWEPLCNFLGQPIPDGEKFPRANDTNGFLKRCKARNRKQLYNVIFRVLVFIALLVMAFFTASKVFLRFLSFGA